MTNIYLFPNVTLLSRSIDDDILNLIDEVDIDKELKEIAEALVDSSRFPEYVREKSAVIVSRFLVGLTYLAHVI